MFGDVRVHDGTPLVSTSGLVWRVWDPPWWRVDKQAVWAWKRLVWRFIAFVGSRVPPRYQTGSVKLVPGGSVVRIVRDAETPLMWVPDGYPMRGPTGLQ